MGNRAPATKFVAPVRKDAAFWPGLAHFGDDLPMYRRARELAAARQRAV